MKRFYFIYRNIYVINQIINMNNNNNKMITITIQITKIVTITRMISIQFMNMILNDLLIIYYNKKKKNTI